MKKILLLLLFPILGYSQWTEDFDSGSTLPAGWAVIDGDGGNSWGIEDLFGDAQSGDNAAAIFYDYNAHDDYLVTKAINVQAGISDKISFYVKSDSDYYLEDYEVLLSTTTQDQSAFTTVLQANSKAPNFWLKKTFDLSAYVGQTVYVAVHATDTNQYILYADSFVVEGVASIAPACAVPSSPLNGAVGVNIEGILSWDAVAEADGYKLKVGTTSGGTDILDNEDVGDLTTYDIPGTLNLSTVYYVTVIPYNTAGSATGCTEISFTTMDPPANDDCSGAVTLTVGGDFAQNAVTGTTLGASDASGLGASCLFDPAEATNNVWFKVEVPASGNITIETDEVSGSDLGDTVMSVFEDCSSTNSIACNDDDGNGNFSKIELSGQVPGTILYISVWKYYSNTDGEFSISAYDSSLLAASEVSAVKKNLVKVYPNPFVDTLTISDVSNVKSVAVYEATGRLVKVFDRPSSSLGLGDLKQGLYMVSLELKDGSKQTVKVIKK
ncbi:choice-of-anchor J domain-containing protein [Chryseobacterium sp. MYb264]|uniref:T9SS-dependent choice-of-anchor J family protein n=1 Tax=Chryseobacterium sp. MYb264 TaxID=2745153 RepID=UPI002E11EF29|nr:choice-of-anchor J domain-containing protein [Chryseobacterium sp. MYb264]